jgi:hypothetical protein
MLNLYEHVFFIFILCLNTITSMINTNVFLDFTDFQVWHLCGRQDRRDHGRWWAIAIHTSPVCVGLRIEPFGGMGGRKRRSQRRRH